MLAELGVHVETCTNEASAAAMLGASINYPLRGAVTWKSIVGTNVAADALSNLASPGVIGGALIILGEDYGEGASVIQERSYAYAMKSSMWLLDPRPDLPTIVRMVEKGFELSEASHAPVMLELRIRACHVTGEFAAKDNRRPRTPASTASTARAQFDYGRLAHPPVTFMQERLKVEERMPAAQAFIREHKLNELIAGDVAEIGIIVMGGLTNGVLRALERLGLADAVRRIAHSDLRAQRRLSAGAGGGTRVLRRQARRAGGRGGLSRLHRAGDQRRAAPRRHPDARAMARALLPTAGEYTSDVLLRGLAAFLAAARPAGIDADCDCGASARQLLAHKPQAAAALGDIAAAPADFLHRLPGAAGVLGASS